LIVTLLVLVDPFFNPYHSNEHRQRLGYLSPIPDRGSLALSFEPLDCLCRSGLTRDQGIKLNGSVKKRIVLCA